MIEATEDTKRSNIITDMEKWRDSTQPLLLKQLPDIAAKNEAYNHIPFHSLGDKRIFSGYGSLAKWIADQKTVLIDGYSGIFYEDIYQQIQNELAETGLLVNWHFTADYLHPESDIDELVKPFLGQKESVWGFRTTLDLKDFYNDDILRIVPDEQYEINIVIGTGASLSGWKAPLVYFDIPKNEIQYRMRAKSVTNLGKTEPEEAFNMYKHFYFVDWAVLDRHRNKLLDEITIVADGQRFNEVNWVFKNDLLSGLRELAHSVFRVRPWFEKGSWGGQWMKENLKGLNNDEINYAWSFELITPENGLIFESDGNLLEVSFDFLMLAEYEAVLGKHAKQFGTYFPVRFDFLDTFDGGNLSIQCHPSKKYIQEQFGETITQDETYYILDCKPGAKVYLGFQEDIDPDEFRTALEESQDNNKKLEIEKYVQSFPSHKHDLFLIPNGTVHSSGVNNMVLEISATPYIFTFKMYDWLSLDLNGNPRPINIDHAFNNLRFERKGNIVEKEHISHPEVIQEGDNWQLVHLPTHRDHFYDVHRIEFDKEIMVETLDVCHLLMLVEGTSLSIEIDGSTAKEFHYAETFIVPAAASQYKLVNHSTQRAKVIKAFIKDNFQL